MKKKEKTTKIILNKFKIANLKSTQEIIGGTGNDSDDCIDHTTDATRTRQITHCKETSNIIIK